MLQQVEFFGTLMDVVQPIFMGEIEFDYRENSILNQVLTFAAYEDSDGRMKIGNRSLELTFTSRKLIIGIFIDVIEELFMANNEFCGKRKVNTSSKFGLLGSIKIPMQDQIL